MTDPKEMSADELADVLEKIVIDAEAYFPHEFKTACDTRDAIARRLRASEAWRPIETAPRDGAPILSVWDAPTPEYPFIGVVSWSDAYGVWISQPGHWPKKPTHWRPLPTPPEPTDT